MNDINYKLQGEKNYIIYYIIFKLVGSNKIILSLLLKAFEPNNLVC